MFALTTVDDAVHIPPALFGQDHYRAVMDRINAKFANRILPGVGLCIACYDLVDVHEPFVPPGEGHIRVKVRFRLVTFRPFRGEVLAGKIRSCTEKGINATVGFFNDIFIPKHLLPEGSEFDDNEQLWVWRIDDAELYMELDDTIRMRVVQSTFTEHQPRPHGTPATALDATKPTPFSTVTTDTSVTSPDHAAPLDGDLLANSEKRPLFSIVCSMNDPGLGCPRWWVGQE